ncbi:drug resistance transporter, EmrB/QacA subfamily [Catenulispora acidiphila DSM 44928]|uniref:Drug resistance transporter, EmrB/QacA subfamily n=1 Tax=Catenulispora acidiphila (strain DSM 44928 / JCM 14897 / NBRC 102108 / NRRL B-24433 / ID139908) TaxID=479433 RepID=C7QHX3_CATAD|nr:MFS transporter [Catenulispora acidiphila]ACU73018.1 drug resistance transporter, EmrB/QacA subfamily [Catenulispora acidiphila DSM 44928]
MSADSTTETTSRPGPDPKWWTLTAVCLGTVMLLLDVTIVNVALPQIQSSLGASFSDVQWVVDAYALTLAALLLTTGSLADQYGRRRLYLIGLVLFTGASVLCGAAQSPLMLELSRGAQGIGGAAMFSVSLALLATAFRGKDRGVAFGVWGALTGVAVAAGPVVGGVLVSGLSWRWIFYVNVPIGIVALVLTATRVRESREEQARKPDWAGFVTFSAALAALVYALIESGRAGFSDSTVVACFVASAVLLAVFLAVELRSPHPMFDLGLFRLPTFLGGDIAAFAMSAGMFAMLLYLVLYLQDVLGYSALQTGVRLLLLSAGVLVASAVSGRLSVKVPVRFLIGPGLALIGLGLVLMRGLDATSSWTHLIPGLIVGGIGVGLVNPPLASTAVGVVEPRRAGMASGINATFRQVGIATGIALLGTLFANRLTSAVTALAAPTPLASHSAEITDALRNGDAARLFATTPPQQRGQLTQIARGAFTTGLNEILLVGSITCFVAAVLAIALIRTKDFKRDHE